MVGSFQLIHFEVQILFVWLLEKKDTSRQLVLVLGCLSSELLLVCVCVCSLVRLSRGPFRPSVRPWVHMSIRMSSFQVPGGHTASFRVCELMPRRHPANHRSCKINCSLCVLSAPRPLSLFLEEVPLPMSSHCGGNLFDFAPSCWWNWEDERPKVLHSSVGMVVTFSRLEKSRFSGGWKMCADKSASIILMMSAWL